MVKLLFVLLIFSQHNLYSQKGIASYYANKFEGRRTATGEIYKHSKLTAASNVFKLGTIVRVFNLVDSTYVDVKINDRMAVSSQRKGRIVDLSVSAFRALSDCKGLINVKVEIISILKNIN